MWVSTLKEKYAAAAAKSLQSCPTLCDPVDGSSPGPPVPGILQARILEWVAISFSSAWKWKVKGKSLSCVWLFATPWTAAYQAPPSMGFSRQEDWSGVPLPPPNYFSSHSYLIRASPIRASCNYCWVDVVCLLLFPPYLGWMYCPLSKLSFVHYMRY